MVLDRVKLKKLLKEKGIKSLEDFNTFMRDVRKDVIETLLEEELTDHLGFEKYDQKAKAVNNSRNGKGTSQVWKRRSFPCMPRG
jgi:putative transposase